MFGDFRTAWKVRGCVGTASLVAAFAFVGPAASAQASAVADPSLAHAARDEGLQRLQQRDQARWAGLTPAERRGATNRDEAQRQDFARESRSHGAPEEIGRWTTAPFEIPAFAINSALLPNGKILFYSYPPRNPDYTRPNEGRAYLWDPSLGTGAGAFTNVPPPRIDVDGDGDTEPASLFCSALSFLPDGRLLVTGGNLANEGDGPYTQDAAGLDTVFVFDYRTEQWIRQPDMEDGRWYPTQVLLPDSRTAILGGYGSAPPGGVFNPNFELFTPGVGTGPGTVSAENNGDRVVENYPHLKVLPDGNVFLAGPGVTDSAILDPDTFGWSNLPSHDREREGSTAVFRAPTPGGSTTVTQIGGFNYETVGPSGAQDAFNSTETMDVSDPAPAWAPDAPLNVGRSYANTVVLPDGTLLEVGGGNGYSDAEDLWRVDPAARQVELLEPGATQWTLGPASVEDRGYHGTALLLPDGRVWSAGDDRHPGIAVPPYSSITDSAEIYTPPYLYRGTRPAISSAPESLNWGDEFGVEETGASKAVLVAPAATTHGNDMNQRLVPLELTSTIAGKGINLRAPANANLALPGNYMLFVLSPEGVPSFAKWVQLRADAPDRPVLVDDPVDPGVQPQPLQPQPPVLPVTDRTPPRLGARIVVGKTRTLRRDGRLRVRISSSEAGSGTLSVRISRRDRRSFAKKIKIRFTRPGARRLTVLIPRTARRVLVVRGTRLAAELRLADASGNAARTGYKRFLR